MRLPLLAAAALCASSLAAHADVLFSVSGTSTTGGSLTGTFTTNDSLTQVLTFDITTPASAPFTSFTYTPGIATVSAESLPSQFFRLDTPGNVDELQFYFGAGLTAQGGTLLATNSYENQPAGGNRFIGGAVNGVPPTAVTPEPSSIALLGTGLLGVAGVLRKRLT